MPRTARIVIPGVPHHITQRGNEKQQVFFEDDDYVKYLALLREESASNGMRILGYCLMPNHVHIIGIPAREDSLANVIGTTHFRYTSYTKPKYGRHGHLWQSRFYSCPMDENHSIRALCYVELNPVRARIVQPAWEYTWSSARAHCFAGTASTLMNLGRWRTRFAPEEWREFLENSAGNAEFTNRIRTCTHKGRPLGDAEFQKHVARYLKNK